ncbi:MAG: hypothetical protein JXQ67_06495 [Campylobacterales bacterium]|nr:hypothetical protein [Campylobacterales bacterium]
MRKFKKIVLLSLGTACLVSSLEADTPKQALKSNYQVIYNLSAKNADSFSSMLSEGNFYGRLRSNNFFYQWESESATQENHITNGVGGSLVYKSASFADFDFTAGLYYSQGFTSVSQENAANMKPGQDVLSRFLYTNTGTTALGVVGQANVRYSGIEKSSIVLGRQIVETFYTKSNDTKMIPNTFDGLVFQTSLFSDTSLKVAYLVEQKLRAHADSHSVLMYGDAAYSSSLKPAWDANDDSAMHKGLTYTNLVANDKRTDAPLIVLDAQNRSVKNLALDGSFYAVPDLISQGMLEANYKFGVTKGLSITPGVRYIKQFDNGAGALGGAALDATTIGYKNLDSLDAQMIAARMVTTYENFKLNLGYTNVLDEADLVTPWRGFPTAGYTRSMARYNWVANTQSYRAELMINDNKSGVYKDVMMQLSILHTDADEAKGQFDENYYYAGFVQNIPALPTAQWRFRIGYQDTEKTDADTLDTRLELNYLF